MDLFAAHDIVNACDLGTYAWHGFKDSESYCDFDLVTTKDVLQRLKMDPANQNLPCIVPKTRLRLPRQLRAEESLAAQKFENRFPHDPGFLVALYAAVETGKVKLEEIDFVIGGSTLEMLAKNNVDNRQFKVGGGSVSTTDDTKYLCQRLPGFPSGPVFICKSSHYVQNYAAVGFQFERLVTGQSIDGKHDPNQVYSLQLLQIGDFRVLCAAEVDARDENGNIVEIKAGNPRFFGTKVMFQMLSSGAKTLVHADRRQLTLLDVKCKSFQQVVQEHKSVLGELVNNIIESLIVVRDSARQDGLVSDEYAVELDFDRSGVVLMGSCSDRVLLPPEEVVRELFGGRGE